MDDEFSNITVMFFFFFFCFFVFSYETEESARKQYISRLFPKEIESATKQ